MKKYWDHKTSPSTFVIMRPMGKGKYTEWKEVFRGTYDDGMMYIKSLDNSGMISFRDDYIPAMQKNTKTLPKWIRIREGFKTANN